MFRPVWADGCIVIRGGMGGWQSDLIFILLLFSLFTVCNHLYLIYCGSCFIKTFLLKHVFLLCCSWDFLFLAGKKNLTIFTTFVRVALINVSKVIFNYARVSSQSQETRPGPGVSSAVLEILYNISTSTQQQHNIQYSLVFEHIY